MADKALLMGINAYKSISTLRGCVNDVKNMRRLLTEQYGFDDKNVRVLTDQQVTKSRARREMAWLMQGAKPGDRLVLHFAGHGSYTVDLDGEEDADGRDELICLYDMDWDNSDSYFTDDELRAWTKKLPNGARLTVLLDNCHSGTGTRQIVTRGVESDDVELPWVDLRTTLARGQATRGSTRAAAIPTSDSDMEAVLEDQVIARFVQPPPEIVAAAANLPARRDIVRSAEGEMNHILLAACRSDQTAADARIGGDYQGAFTYHLCEAVRAGGGSVSCARLIADVRTRLQQGMFAQVPQLEPQASDGMFLARQREADEPLDEEPLSDAPTTTSPGTTPAMIGSTDAACGQSVPFTLDAHNQRLVLEILHKLVYASSGAPSRPETSRASGARHVVYVHGICKHETGYSNGWWQSMRRFTPSLGAGELGGTRHEVLWSDWVNSRAAVRALDRGTEQQVDELTAELQDALEDRLVTAQLVAETEQTDDRSPRAAMPQAVPRGAGLGCIDDFSRYMLMPSIRRGVLDEFHRVVRPLLQSGASLEIVAHSWGTVVSYEGLLELDAQMGLSGRVRNWFVVGSALSLPPVKRWLSGAAKAGQRPRLANRWINLDARGDVVGGALRGRPYDVDEEFLNLQPIGCGSFVGLVNPTCAHSSYFVSANTAVNQGIFGRFVESA